MPHKHGRQTAGHTRQEAMKKPYHTISHTKQLLRWKEETAHARQSA